MIKPGEKGYLVFLYQIIFFSAEVIKKKSEKEDKEHYITTESKFGMHNELTDPRYNILVKMYENLYYYISTHNSKDPFLAI